MPDLALTRPRRRMYHGARSCPITAQFNTGLKSGSRRNRRTLLKLMAFIKLGQWVCESRKLKNV